MEKQDHLEELLNFFKALSDSNRLKIIGLLAQRNAPVEQLAQILGLSASTVSHHLTRLSEAGLVSARPESYYNVYQLETGALEDMARRLLSEETLPNLAADVDIDAYDRKIIHDYTLPDGRLKTIPSQRKKLEAVLNYIIKEFKPGVEYSEKEVTDILRTFHEDAVSLRRELIDYRLLERDKAGKSYWRTSKLA
jgi:predicted transcriptional regulator